MDGFAGVSSDDIPIPLLWHEPELDTFVQGASGTLLSTLSAWQTPSPGDATASLSFAEEHCRPAVKKPPAVAKRKQFSSCDACVS